MYGGNITGKHFVSCLTSPISGTEVFSFVCVHLQKLAKKFKSRFETILQYTMKASDHVLPAVPRLGLVSYETLQSI